jgi:hypothetical protein
MNRDTLKAVVGAVLITPILYVTVVILFLI